MISYKSNMFGNHHLFKEIVAEDQYDLLSPIGNSDDEDEADDADDEAANYGVEGDAEDEEAVNLPG